MNAALHLFERDGVFDVYLSRMSLVRVFKRGEIFALCNAVLAKTQHGLDTRELAVAVLQAKGMTKTMRCSARLWHGLSSTSKGESARRWTKARCEGVGVSLAINIAYISYAYCRTKAISMTNKDNSEKQSHDFTYPVAIVGMLCVIGGLVFLGLLSDRSTTTIHFAAFALVAGIALILAASGSRASGKYGVWTVSGAGALLIILFPMLEHYLAFGSAKFGRIEGDFSKVADLRIIDDHPLYEYRDPTTKSIQFIMLKEKFNHPRIAVQVDTTDKDIFFEMIGNGDEIAKKHIGKSWEDTAIWDFDYRKRIIRDGNDIIFKEISDQDEEIIPPKKASLSYSVAYIFSSAALPPMLSLSGTMVNQRI